MVNLSDKKKIVFFNSSELYNRLVSMIEHNRLLHKNCFLLKKKNNSKVKISNNCIITGRSRSVYRKFRVSRLQIKYLSKGSKILGLRKAS